MRTTAKELDDIDIKILTLAAEGKAVKQIAYHGNINPHTVAARLREMRRYFKCSNTTELISKLHSEIHKNV
jgi:DNA-binding CsgD family transcriptional regulator